MKCPISECAFESDYPHDIEHHMVYTHSVVKIAQRTIEILTAVELSNKAIQK